MRLVSCVVCCALFAPLVGADDKWVTIKGRVVFPDGKPISKRAALNVNADGQHCLKDGPILDESILVNAKTRGVKNVVVYLRPLDMDPKAKFEKGQIPTERKVELIDALSETGLQEIQVVSFVNPKRVPGMADADQVVQQFRKKPGVKYSGLWLNEQGLHRAIATNKIDVKGRMVLCASEPFLARNQNSSLEQMVQGVRNMIAG